MIGRRFGARARARSGGAAIRPRALIITLGESLVVGAASDASGFPTTYPATPGRLYKFNDSAVWESLTDPVENTGAAPVYSNIADVSILYGYTGLLAWRYQKLLPASVDVGLVPCGRSGTTSWEWATNLGLYSDAVAKVQAALRYPGARVEAIVIDQGVNDCHSDDDPGVTWSDRWSAVLAGLRTACGIPNSVPTYYRQLPATVSAAYDTTLWNNLRTEQAAWESTSAPKRIMVAANDDGFVGAGNPHYAAVGNKDYSRRVQLKIEEHPGPLLAATPAQSGERAFSGFTTTPRLGSRTGKGPIGVTGTGVALVFLARLNAVPSVAQVIISCRSAAGNTGADLRISGSALLGRGGNTTTSVNTPGRTLVSGDVGKLHLGCVSVDGSNVFLYFDNASIGSTALTGYTASTAKFTIGLQTDGTSPCLDWTILGALGKNAALSLADFQSICAASKAAGRLDIGAVAGLHHLYPMPRVRLAPDWVPDLIGGRAHDLEFSAGSEADLAFNVLDPASFTWGF